MNFSARIAQQIEQIGIEQEKAAAEEAAQLESAKQAAIAAVKRELAPILDDEWQVSCGDDPKNPQASCDFEVDAPTGGKDRFRVIF